jgi:hypothetical protein
MLQDKFVLSNRRRTERGAALITTLMLSALLLTAGGMLILTTTMTGLNTIDATAESQAYYGAEAGLQAALDVLRGHVMPNPLFAANPAGGVAPANQITFAKAVQTATSNLASDPAATLPRLSRWLTYSYPASGFADRVPISQNYTPMNGIAYSVIVSDPDGKTIPIRLLITSTGYGPRGARKTLSLLVSFGLVIDEVPAPLVLRGHDDRSTEMNLDLGSSGAETYSGVDNSIVDPIKPALAMSNHDVPAFLDATAKLKSKVLTAPQYKVLNLPNEPAPAGMGVEPPWFLKTANDARTFVAQAEKRAKQLADNGQKGVVVNTLNGAAGGPGNSWLTVVKGDCNLTSGSGLLVVEGTLSIAGSGINFDGLILVLGTGKVIKTGGGNKDTYGSIMVARFGPTGDFLDPTFDVNGGGSTNVQYDSKSVASALDLTGKRALGFVEK